MRNYWIKRKDWQVNGRSKEFMLDGKVSYDG
jgi:hypothetical protein